MGHRPRLLTRRAFACSLAAAPAFGQHRKGGGLPSERYGYSDPATEMPVVRLTDPAHASRLPAYYQRIVARRNTLLLFSSDRTGSQQAYRMDPKSGAIFQLTTAQALDPAFLTLAPDDRGFYWFDGPSLRYTALSNLREREIYRVPEGWERAPGGTVADDGSFAVFAERRPGGSRLRLVGLSRGVARTVTEEDWEIAHPLPHPRRAQVLYRKGDEALWLVNTDGQKPHRLALADGTVGPADWAPDGKSILYLNIPADKTQLNAIREYMPDLNTDKLVSKTSQFVHFGFNRDSSVFVGASRNQASPNILLLLRLTRREFTLCEHRASDPASVAPIFSPDSRAVYFQSDRHGKTAIYTVGVDKLVEETES
jgi:oligogalacturonide lyase